MTKTVRAFTKEDKLLLAVAFLNAGIKARIKMLDLGARVVFEASQDAVAEVLNSEGFLHANGGPFGQFSFQGNQAFVRYVSL
jgi:hypothetical protein